MYVATSDNWSNGAVDWFTLISTPHFLITLVLLFYTDLFKSLYNSTHWLSCFLTSYRILMSSWSPDIWNNHKSESRTMLPLLGTCCWCRSRAEIDPLSFKWRNWTYIQTCSNFAVTTYFWWPWLAACCHVNCNPVIGDEISSEATMFAGHLIIIILLKK